MKVIVTGATSFIGAAVVKRLLEVGHSVCAVVRPGSANLQHLLDMTKTAELQHLPNMMKMADLPKQLDMMKAAELSDPVDNNSKVKTADAINKETNEALKIIELDLHRIGELKENADAWIHIGWDGAGSENRTKRDVQQGNVVQSLAAVRAAAAAGCRRFIFTGSQAEYGVKHDWIREDADCVPVSEYGKAKVDFADSAKKLCKTLKIEYIHTRIFSIYGPGDHPWSLVNTCLQTWRQGGHMQLGECTQQWNFLYIEDVASALCHLLTEGNAGFYNLASEDTRPLRSYIEEMYQLCGNQGDYAYGTRPQNAEGPADLMPDIGKILRETSWRPRISFADGIRKMLCDPENAL